MSNHIFSVLTYFVMGQLSAFFPYSNLFKEWRHPYTRSAWIQEKIMSTNMFPWNQGGWLMARGIIEAGLLNQTLKVWNLWYGKWHKHVQHVGTKQAVKSVNLGIWRVQVRPKNRTYVDTKHAHIRQSVVSKKTSNRDQLRSFQPRHAKAKKKSACLWKQ